MISIQNNIGEAEINIFGDIGEDMFGEGNTKESVLADLEGITANKITVNISSLGGSVDDALAIYTQLRNSKAHVTTVMSGFTASSGTIIAMAGDTILQDPHSLGLVHNAWTVSMGNSVDMRKTAEELDKIDNVIADIYQDAIKRNGKSKTKAKILKLMAEEKWITPSEAQDFGLISGVTESIKAAASIKKEIEGVQAIKELPQIPENYINQIEMEKEIKLSATERISGTVNVERLEEIGNTIQAEFNSLSEDFKVTKADLEDVKNTLNVKNEELEGSITKIGELETEKETLNTEIQNKATEIEDLKAKIESLKNEALAEPIVEGSNGEQKEAPVAEKSAKQKADEFRAKRARGEK